MNRKPVVGMSLKIYVNKMDEASSMAEEIRKRFEGISDMDIFLIPSMGTVYPVALILQGSNILYGVQNIAPKENGAMTGEFSIESAIDLGCRVIELGHAERKGIFREDYEMISEKIRLTLKHGLIPVICIGETEKGPKRRDELTKQIRILLKGVSASALSGVILAYEPEWAIGKDRPAEAEYVHESMAMIRKILSEEYGEEAGSVVRLIYGGSANKENASELVSSGAVDGLFIGRFGHEMDNLEEIISNVRKIKEET